MKEDKSDRQDLETDNIELMLNKLDEYEAYTIKEDDKKIQERQIIAVETEDDKSLYIREDVVKDLFKSQHEMAKKALDEMKRKQEEKLEQWNDTYEEKKAELETIQRAYKEQERQSTENYETLAQTIFQGINNLDQMIAAFRESNELVSQQLTSVTNIIINQLAMIGIIEIPTYGKEIDGEYMESMGVVSIDDVADKQLKEHQVAKVIRRAFKDEKTNKILQFALVETIMGDK